MEAAGAERFAALRKSISFALRGVLNSFGSGSVKAIPETSKFLNSDARVLQFFDQIDAKLGRIPILPLHFDWATVASFIGDFFLTAVGDYRMHFQPHSAKWPKFIGSGFSC